VFVRVAGLDDAGDLPSVLVMCGTAYNRSLAMLMAMVVLLARGVYVSHPLSGQVGPGCYAWCVDQSRLVVGQFIFLYCRASCFVILEG
jgi:hypothetical protein